MSLSKTEVSRPLFAATFEANSALAGTPFIVTLNGDADGDERFRRGASVLGMLGLSEVSIQMLVA